MMQGVRATCAVAAPRLALLASWRFARWRGMATGVVTWTWRAFFSVGVVGVFAPFPLFVSSGPVALPLHVHLLWEEGERGNKAG